MKGVLSASYLLFPGVSSPGINKATDIKKRQNKRKKCLAWGRSSKEVLVPSPALHDLQAPTSAAQHLEDEAGGAQDDYPQPHSKVQASLGYIQPYLEKKKEKRKKNAYTILNFHSHTPSPQINPYILSICKLYSITM